MRRTPRLVLFCGGSSFVDFDDYDTRAQNGWNRGACRGSASVFKGVFWNKGRWNAQIKVNGRVRDLGRHDTQEEAAHAYDDAAITAHGPFARTNLKVVLP